VALLAFLDHNPHIGCISLCLDADEAGRTAADKITAHLDGDERLSHITVTIDPPPYGKKDYNEALIHAVRQERAQKQAGHRKEAGVSI
jgi:DNA primase